MPILVVGKTEIPYRLRRSSNAVRRHIVVTPGHVEVVVPEGAEEEAVEAFVHQLRRWVYDKLEEVGARARKVEGYGPSRFVSWAKIPFRGRRMRMTPRGGSR